LAQGTVSTTLAGVTSRLAGIALGQLTQALTDISTLQTLVGGVDVPGLSSQVSGLATRSAPSAASTCRPSSTR